MSELKEHRIVGMDERCARVDNDYYLKSEADKVIEKLNQKLDDYRYTIAVLRKEKSRHKYKRCLAMAKWCLYWANYWETCEPSDCSMFIIKARYYRKWYKHWKKLAEKFKEAK